MSAAELPTLPGDDEYGSRVRFSRLKLMSRSPAHYLANPQGDSSALDKGTALHSAILGGKRIAYYTKKTESGRSAPRNGKDWEAFKAQNSDALILSEREYDETMRMVESVQAHKDAMALLHAPGAVKEQTIHFDMLNLPCRTTPDSRSPGLCVELKTCRSSQPNRFESQSYWLSYHAQCAFHLEGIRRAKLDKDPTPYIVAVESSAPYPVTIFRVTPKAIEDGDKKIRVWIEQLKGCLASNAWPAYAQSPVDLNVPEEDGGLVFGNDNDSAPFMKDET